MRKRSASMLIPHPASYKDDASFNEALRQSVQSAFQRVQMMFRAVKPQQEQMLGKPVNESDRAFRMRFIVALDHLLVRCKIAFDECVPLSDLGIDPETVKAFHTRLGIPMPTYL